MIGTFAEIADEKKTRVQDYAFGTDYLFLPVMIVLTLYFLRFPIIFPEQLWSSAAEVIRNHPKISWMHQ